MINRMKTECVDPIHRVNPVQLFMAKQKNAIFDFDRTDMINRIKTNRVNPVHPVNPVQLLVPEHLALDDLVNNVSHKKIIFASSIENGVQFFTIRKLDFATRGINNKLRNEMFCDLLFFTEQVLFEFIDSRELLSIGGHATGIDDWSILVSTLCEERKNPTAGRSILCSESTDRIKTL